MKRTPVVHPLLVAVYPVLFLYCFNNKYLTLHDVLLPLAIVLGAAVLLWGLLVLVIRDHARAGLMVSLFFIVFFAYGHGSNYIAYTLPGLPMWIRTVAWPLALVAALVVLTYLLARARTLTALTTFANAAAVVMMVTVLTQIGMFESKRLGTKVERIETTAPVKALNIDIAKLPNIYYIILDGYGRQDVLREIYHYDNYAFLDHLRSRGFFVADESHANYCQTLLSLSSSLNATYLDKVAQEVGKARDDREPLSKLIRDNMVARQLRQYGYRTVAFASGYPSTEISEADHYFNRSARMSEFQHLIFNTSLLAAIPKSTMRKNQDESAEHRAKVLYPLDHLAETTKLDGPFFAFAHVVCPHPPFLFDAQGQPVNLEQGQQFSIADGDHYQIYGGTHEEYVRQYREQIQFVTAKVQTMIDNILDKSTRPVIIVLQSDHGPGSRLSWEDPEATYVKERLGILNAIYLPDGNTKALYADMTPVNTFRIILNQFFGAQFARLPDESYFSRWKLPYAFVNVTARVNPSFSRRNGDAE